MIGERIKQFRLASGLSLDELVAKMGGIVTKQAISKYEVGKSVPSPRVLTSLASALGVKAAYLVESPLKNIQFIAYRKRSTLLKRDRIQLENKVRCLLEDRVRLQEIIAIKNREEIPVQSVNIKSIEEAENAAEILRKKWSLGNDAIASIVNSLEDHLIHVLEIDANEKFDGIAAVARDSRNKIVAAAVVTRRMECGERQRFNLAHEMGHLILNISKNIDEEKVAFRFAGAFLAPKEVLIKETGIKRTAIMPDELFLLKKRFGISIQALLYRLKDLKIISHSHYNQWFRMINQLSWRKKEPQPLEKENPQWLRRNILKAVCEGVMDIDRAEKMLGDKITKDRPLSLVNLRSFMRLPVKERKRLMEEQANKLADYYKDEVKKNNIGGGDIIEY